jgi:hypothetical protein
MHRYALLRQSLGQVFHRSQVQTETLDVMTATDVPEDGNQVGCILSNN